jgi:hypothetical protein
MKKEGVMAEETQVTIRVGRAEYREFRAECIRRDVTPTGMLQNFIRRQVEAWKMPAAPPLEGDARQLDLFLHTKAEEGL